MGKQMFDRIKKMLSDKKILSVFVVPFFVVSVTAVVDSYWHITEG